MAEAISVHPTVEVSAVDAKSVVRLPADNAMAIASSTAAASISNFNP